MDTDFEFSCTPPELEEAAKEASLKMLPSKSRQMYENAYLKFIKWQADKRCSSFSETVLLAYFSELAQKVKPSTLWAQYSMTKSTLQMHNNVDISKYCKLLSYLKQNSKGYKSKKSKIFSGTQINEFLNNASDESYLMFKVAAIFGIAGACRSAELCQMTLDDIEDLGTSLVVKINQTKNDVSRRFVVTEEYVKFYKKYIGLRPPTAKDRRLFYGYRNGKCVNQVVGKNQFYKVPEITARFLGLENPKLYTGHSFRRSSATLLVESGGDLITLKKHGGWKSSTIAEGYVDESVLQRREIASRVLGSCGSALAKPNCQASTSKIVVSSSENVNETERLEHIIDVEDASTSVGTPPSRNKEMRFVQCTFNNCSFN